MVALTTLTQSTLSTYEHVPQIAPQRPPETIKKEFLTHMRSLSHARHSWQIWADFVEMAAISIHNRLVYMDTELEEQYLTVAGRYDAKDLAHFPEMLKLCWEVFQGDLSDFLGQIFQELELASHWHGQFFTPYPVCQMLAQMTMDPEQFEQKDVVQIHEPACGAGAMILAAAEYMNDHGIDYGRQAHFVAQDLDFTAVCMTYIQLSIAGVSAKVVHGNTLSMKIYQQFLTPMAVYWGRIT